MAVGVATNQRRLFVGVELMQDRVFLYMFSAKQSVQRK